MTGRVLRKSNDPILQRLFVELHYRDCTWQEIERRSGVSYRTIQNWEHVYSPTLPNVVAVGALFSLKLRWERTSS